MENMSLALEKEREIVKEETALRKGKEAVCCYTIQGCIQSCTCTCTCTSALDELTVYQSDTTCLYTVRKGVYMYVRLVGL